jgi:hypothetical protein
MLLSAKGMHKKQTLRRKGAGPSPISDSCNITMNHQGCGIKYERFWIGIGSCVFQMSAKTPKILTEFYHRFPLSVHWYPGTKTTLPRSLYVLVERSLNRPFDTNIAAQLTASAIHNVAKRTVKIKGPSYFEKKWIYFFLPLHRACCHFHFTKNQLMHPFHHFYIHIKTPEDC